mgnify:CR=1 FL=1
MNKVPEVLAPAGSLEKLKVAIDYGANAVYLAGQQFGLRSAAENFTYDELKEGVEYAHDRSALVYVVLNGFLHDEDIEKLNDFIQYLEQIKVDAVIVSDLGVVKFVSDNSNLEVHLSTQASCLNSYNAKFWKKLGVTRVVLGREATLSEAKQIKEKTGLEIEMFVHGSMCMAYSGNCVISNFTQGRDSNRGGCAHSCRFEYSLKFEDNIEAKNRYFMSSKDLNGLRVLEQFVEAGIDSIKIEGRMKSELYAGTTSKVYSEALNFYKENGSFLSNDLLKWEEELSKIVHRDYSEASLINKADKSSIFDEREHSKESEYKVVGKIVESIKDQAIVIHVKNAFNIGDQVEIFPPKGEKLILNIDWIKQVDNPLLDRSKPSTLVKLPFLEGELENSLVRMKS